MKTGDIQTPDTYRITGTVDAATLAEIINNSSTGHGLKIEVTGAATATEKILQVTDGTTNFFEIDGTGALTSDGASISIQTDKVIRNQTDFAALFDGTDLEDVSIFLKNNGTPYELTNAGSIKLKNNVKIYSDGAIVNRADISARFHTTFKETLGIASATGAIFTMDSDPSSVFYPGDIVHTSHDDTFYQIENTDSTTVTVDRNISNSGSYGSSENLRSCTTGIHTKGWTFDGQNNVNGLGGAIGTFVGSGGAFNIQYCADSVFEAIVSNSKVSADGGAYYGNITTFNIDIFNVDNCSALSSGGGVAYCTYSNISKIKNCSAVSSGGGVLFSHYSSISDISWCSSSGSGGGISGCDYSKISNISDCNANNGGGCYGCNYGIITNVPNCSATTTGGGISTCDGSTYLGNFGGCTAATNDHINASTGWATASAGASNLCYVQGGSYQTINWDSTTIGSLASLTNTTKVTNLNADLLDGLTTGNATGNIPISNGTVCDNLNADELDGLDASNTANNVPILDSNARLPVAQNPACLGWNTTGSTQIYLRTYTISNTSTINLTGASGVCTDFLCDLGYSFSATDSSVVNIGRDMGAPGGGQRVYFNSAPGVPKLCTGTLYYLSSSGS